MSVILPIHIAAGGLAMVLGAVALATDLSILQV
jgi:hypothetical protein